MTATQRIPSTNWITPPEAQGQTIERSYAQDDDGECWERTIDRSGPTTTYRGLGHASDIGVWEPWNRTPTCAQS